MAIGVRSGACAGAGTQSIIEVDAIACGMTGHLRSRHHRGRHKRCSGRPGWCGQAMSKTATRRRRSTWRWMQLCVWKRITEMDLNREKCYQSLECHKHRYGRAHCVRQETHIGTWFYIQSVQPVHQQVRSSLVTYVHGTDVQDNWQVRIPADQNRFIVDAARALVRSVTQHFNQSLVRETVRETETIYWFP